MYIAYNQKHAVNDSKAYSQLYTVYNTVIATTLSKSFFFFLSKTDLLFLRSQSLICFFIFCSVCPFQIHRCLVVCPPATIAHPHFAVRVSYLFFSPCTQYPFRPLSFVVCFNRLARKIRVFFLI